MKDPVEILFPSGDRFFIVLRVEESRDRVAFTMLEDLPLYIGYSPTIETLVSGPPTPHALLTRLTQSVGQSPGAPAD
jgi:hypothetical protein